MFVLLTTLSAFGQTTAGRILGTVTDQTGAVVKGARLFIADTDHGTSRAFVSNEAGDYVASNLAPGLYAVTAEAQGFKRTTVSAVRVEVARDVRIDLHLEPGAITQTITVTAEAPILVTTNDTLGGTFSNQAINDLPLKGRDFQNLVVLRPGVQRYPGGGFLSISSNGNRPEDNNFIVDGIDNNDPYYSTTVINQEGVQGTPATHLPIDAIQEFNVQENPPAEFGWKPGAIVNVGLKSGTNDLHGTGFYFGRNNVLDARNWFNSKPDPQKGLRLHQFGVSVGGPIVRKKLFYFGAYEGVRDLVGNAEILQTPATASVGDSSQSIPDAISSVQTHGLPVNALSQKLAALFPTNAGINSQGPGNLSLGFPNTNREDNALIKTDYHMSDRHMVAVRYFIGDSLQVERDIPFLQPEWRSQAQTRVQVLGVNWVWMPGPRWSNEMRFGYNRLYQSIFTLDHTLDPQSYGINTGVVDPLNFGMPEIAVTGFTSLGGVHGWPLLTTPNETFQLTDNVSYTAGKHAFKFGGEFRHGSTVNTRDPYGKGRIRFQGGLAFAGSSPLEDFIAGFPSRGRVFIGNSQRHARIQSAAGFIQDDWRISSRLTLNLGLRYSVNGAIKEENNLLGNFDANHGLLQVGRDVDAPYKVDRNNFAPRLGLAWDPWGHGKTVIRAGGSVIYEIPPLQVFLGQNGMDNSATPGINVVPTGALGVQPGGGKIATGTVDVDGSALHWNMAGPVFPSSTIDCNASPCDTFAVDPNLRTPYVISWNLNVQQAIGPSTSLQVGYVGSKGIKLYSVYDINQVDPNSPAEIACGHCEQGGRPFATKFPFLRFINQLTNGYGSSYNGLQASLTQRTAHGLYFVAGYTYSHSLDQASLNRPQQPQDSRHPELEYGNSDLDIRHRFTLSTTYAIPGRKSWGQMLQGWGVNSIVVLQGGQPWSVVDGFVSGDDISLTGEFTDRWNFAGNPKDFRPSPSGPIPFFAPNTFGMNSGQPLGNAACLAQAPAGHLAEFVAQLATFGCYVEGTGVLTPPLPGQYGTMGRNIFRGPGLYNWDFSVTKDWRLADRATLQFRAEFFNILNHPSFANPFGVGGQLANVDPSVPSSFGLASATPDVAAANPVLGTGGPRNIQFGLKVRF